MRGHLVFIRKDGQPVGVQLRTGRGKGMSEYFSVGSYGSIDLASSAAKKVARARGIELGNGRGGVIGRRVVGTKIEPGITFRWRDYNGGPRLVVEVTWPDRGRPRKTCYSVEVNGLEGALDKAIAKRVKAGAPRPDRQALLEDLRLEYVTKAWVGR